MKYLNKYEQLKNKKLLNDNNLQYYLNNFCKDFSFNDTPIYKGIKNSEKDLILINPKSSNRKSSNTNNYYTLLFDNSPYRHNYPKRSKSIICTNSYSIASSYGTIYRVIPYDGAKIAVCDSYDFWYSFKELKKYNLSNLNDFNKKLDYLYRTLINKKLEENDYKILINQIKELLIKIKLKKEIDFPKTLKKLFKMLDPIKNNIKLFNYNEYKNKNFDLNYEVWTDSKVILIEQ